MCDRCQGQLFRRDDDEQKTVLRRIEVYKDQTAPLADHYEAEGVLRRIDATGRVDNVTRRAIAALDDAGED